MASTSPNSSNTHLETLSDMVLKIFHRTGKIQRAADGIRSRDLVLTKHALYQAELRRHGNGDVLDGIYNFFKT